MGGGMAGAGGGAGNMCMQSAFNITQTSMGAHDHLPLTNPTDLVMHVNGATATMAFTLPMDGNPMHMHTITLTQQQVDTLRGGGSVTGVVSSTDSMHSHTYTISCMA
jgi:hypothetical protein